LPPGYYFAVIAVGNLLGPLVLGRLFDTIGRKPMIAGTYILSGLLLLGTAYLFDQGALTATTMTICWCVVLFFASAGASAAYLTVSEVFPMETRALAIAFFYAIGTAAGGITGPLLFSKLMSTGKVPDTALAFAIGASLMILAGLVEIILGVRAERRAWKKRPAADCARSRRPAGRATDGALTSEGETSDGRCRGCRRSRALRDRHPAGRGPDRHPRGRRASRPRHPGAASRCCRARSASICSATRPARSLSFRRVQVTSSRRAGT
jgi:MFS family permease